MIRSLQFQRSTLCRLLWVFDECLSYHKHVFLIHNYDRTAWVRGISNGASGQKLTVQLVDLFLTQNRQIGKPFYEFRKNFRVVCQQTKVCTHKKSSFFERILYACCRSKHDTYTSPVHSRMSTLVGYLTFAACWYSFPLSCCFFVAVHIFDCIN